MFEVISDVDFGSGLRPRTCVWVTQAVWIIRPFPLTLCFVRDNSIGKHINFVGRFFQHGASRLVWPWLIIVLLLLDFFVFLLLFSCYWLLDDWPSSLTKTLKTLPANSISRALFG